MCLPLRPQNKLLLVSRLLDAYAAISPNDEWPEMDPCKLQIALQFLTPTSGIIGLHYKFKSLVNNFYSLMTKQCCQSSSSSNGEQFPYADKSVKHFLVLRISLVRQRTPGRKTLCKFETAQILGVVLGRYIDTNYGWIDQHSAQCRPTITSPNISMCNDCSWDAGLGIKQTALYRTAAQF